VAAIKLECVADITSGYPAGFVGICKPTVIYNGAPPVRASVQLADRYLVLLNNIVPSDTIIIGIKRGLETGTYIYYADTRGAIIQTVAARCEGQAY
jgi:hypothetical protein